MPYRPSHAKRGSLARFAARGGVIASAAAIAAATAGSLAPGAANADTTTPLQVTLGAQASSDTGGVLGNGTSTFDKHGNVTLAVGDADGANSAAVEVQNPGAPGNVTPPSFTTDSYSGGSPRWVIELSNGNYVFGYPKQVSGTANDAFTGAQWQGVSGTGAYDTQAYVTYQKALQDEGDINGNVPVTNAFIVDDAPSASPVTVSDIQYHGQTLGGNGTVSVNGIGDATDTAGTSVDIDPSGSTNTSDTTLTWSATGLPSTLSIDSVTGEIQGTPSSAGTYPVTVTATNAYGQSASQAFTLTVKSATPAVTWTASKNGGTGTIRNAHSGKYMNVMASTYATGSKIAQWGAAGASHEKFQIVTLTGSNGTKAGYLEAIAPDGGKWFVVANGGGQLQLGGKAPAYLTDAAAEGATIAKSPEDMLKSGSYYTFPNDGGKVADDSRQSLANGAPVIAYAKNGGKNQQWSLP